MSLITFDNVLENPKDYVSDIHLHGFQDVADGQHIFRNIQPRDCNNYFAKFVTKIFPDVYRMYPISSLHPSRPKEEKNTHFCQGWFPQCASPFCLSELKCEKPYK